MCTTIKHWIWPPVNEVIDPELVPTSSKAYEPTTNEDTKHKYKCLINRGFIGEDDDCQGDIYFDACSKRRGLNHESIKAFYEEHALSESALNGLIKHNQATTSIPHPMRRADKLTTIYKFDANTHEFKGSVDIETLKRDVPPSTPYAHVVRYQENLAYLFNNERDTLLQLFSTSPAPSPSM